MPTRLHRRHTLDHNIMTIFNSWRTSCDVAPHETRDNPTKGSRGCLARAAYPHPQPACHPCYGDDNAVGPPPTAWSWPPTPRINPRSMHRRNTRPTTNPEPLVSHTHRFVLLGDSLVALPHGLPQPSLHTSE